MKVINTRLSNNDYADFMKLLSTIKVKRSAFIRFAIKKYMVEAKTIITNDTQE